VRWEEEVPQLGELPPTDYDTSLKFFRKVYKDCLLSYGGNRYYVPPEAVGKRVLLKIKGDLVRIYDDDTLLKQYQITDQKGRILGIPRPQSTSIRSRCPATAGTRKGNQRTYHQVSLSGGLPPPLSEYERYAAGGA